MEKSKESKTNNEGRSWKVAAASLVRSVLVLHSIMAAWRVRIAYDNRWMWCLIFGNIPLLLEGMMVVKYNGGNEWKWWCPCFFLYMGSTLPSIWLLQLSQNDKLQPTTMLSMVQPTAQYLVGDATSNFTAAGNLTGTTNSTDIGNFTDNTTLLTSTIPTTTDPGILVTIEEFLDLEDTTWIVVMQEALMYLIVFGRWILPRAEVSRVALSDLLLLYLAMASDIMELYAVFDEQVVQENREVTFAILIIWSISFLQFVPVLAQKNKYRHLQSPHLKRLTRACGMHFTEVVTTLSSILLQDGPFFCLRLYIMVEFQLITYSLVFFVLKNFVSVLLLIYRLVILCLRLPCCYDDGMKRDEEEFTDAEFVSPARYSDTFITTNGRYYPVQPRLVNLHQNHPPQWSRQPKTSRPHSSPPKASPRSNTSPWSKASPRSVTSPSSQVFVLTAGKQKFIAKPGVVYRTPLKKKTERLGSL